jgi:toxin CptA
MREIELKPSRLLGLLLVGMALLALAAIYFSTLPDGVQWALALAGLGLGGWRWQRLNQPARLRIAADGRLQGLGNAGEWCEVEVLGDSFVSTGLIVLRYRLDGQALPSLTVLPDSAPADDLRRLRVALRWIRRTRSGTSFPDAG